MTNVIFWKLYANCLKDIYDYTQAFEQKFFLDQLYKDLVEHFRSFCQFQEINKRIKKERIQKNLFKEVKNTKFGLRKIFTFNTNFVESHFIKVLLLILSQFLRRHYRYFSLNRKILYKGLFISARPYKPKF